MNPGSSLYSVCQVDAPFSYFCGFSQAQKDESKPIGGHESGVLNLRGKADSDGYERELCISQRCTKSPRCFDDSYVRVCAQEPLNVSASHTFGTTVRS